MESRRILLVVLSALIAGCAADRPEAEDQFVYVADMAELMGHIVDPAADVYWSAGGVIVDAEGEHFMVPESDEEWEALSNAAMTLAESGNLLLMDGRRRDDGAWVEITHQFIDVSRQALEAADARNLDAVFDMGAEVYYICTNCHATYAIETLRPTDSRAN
jgi:hypothetical protein